jgi:hypothetical protein
MKRVFELKMHSQLTQKNCRHCRILRITISGSSDKNVCIVAESQKINRFMIEFCLDMCAIESEEKISFQPQHLMQLFN